MAISRKLKILVVEDDVIQREVLVNILRNAGHKALDAKSALVALRQLDDTKVDLIVTDIMMPMMDGIEFLAKLKKDPRTLNTPVLMMTSSASKETVKEALLYGIVGFLVKPVSAKAILKKIDQIADSIEPIIEDVRFVTNRLGINILKFRELLKKFTVSAAEQSSMMYKAVKSNQINEFLNAAYNLSTTASSLGAIGIKEAVDAAIKEIPNLEFDKREKYINNVDGEIQRLSEILPNITLTSYK